MKELFISMINRSILAGWLILAVLLLRVVFKKAPKWIHVLLWGIVALRLVFPFSIESPLSLIPSAETIPMNIELEAKPAINSGVSAINNAVNPMLSSFAPSQEVMTSANPLQIWIPILSIIWVIGIVLLLLYTLVSYWQLCRKVNTAVRWKDNIFQSENVGSPFVMGVIKPRIYLPFQLEDRDLKYVVAHEQAHIRRKDHWWKPLGFLLLTIYWFHPLVWLAYVLLCRDIELACDEKVIKELNSEQRADYSQALVTCSISQHKISACPIAFGEVGVAERVKSVANYKKPALWVIILAIIACAGVSVCFLTDPKKDHDGLEEVIPDSMTVSEDTDMDENEVIPPAETELAENVPGLSEHWILDTAYTEECNPGLSIEEMLGTTLNNGSTYLYLSGDGTIEYQMGNLTGKGSWQSDGDTGNYLAKLIISPEERNETVTFYEFRESPESRTYLVFDYEGYMLFWTME